MSQDTVDDPPIINDLCQNCGQALQGEYCSNCGQRNREFIRFFPTLISEIFEGLFAFNSRTYISLWYLLSRPAFLSNEYLSGRRTQYLPPMRLFLVFLLVFIFTISLELFLESVGVILDSEEELGPVPELESTDSDPTVTITCPRGSNEIVINGGDDSYISDILEFLGNIELPFISEERNQDFVQVLQAQTEANIPAIQENPRDFVGQLLEYVPIMMLILMPLLALIQQVAYLGSGRYYIEHLVLTIHNHSFLFFAFIILFVLDLLTSINITAISFTTNLISTLISLWIIVYLFLSLKFFFQEGYIITFVKNLMISIIYGVCMITGIVSLVIFGFFTY